MPEVPESHKDLLQAPVAVLATNGSAGQPQVSALWFMYDESDGKIKMSLNDSRQKLKNLQRDPRCTLFILDPRNPYRTLEVRARASLTPDPDYAFANKLGKKYDNPDLRGMDQPGQSRFIVTLDPLKYNIWG
jgi:PPOX class probable F420-dependent enzyme